MKRIQRRRTRGWRMPEDAVYVGRPTRWGNPFRGERTKAIELYRFWLKRRISENPSFLDPLIGKNLACRCPLDRPCHADVILEFLKELGGARRKRAAEVKGITMQTLHPCGFSPSSLRGRPPPLSQTSLPESDVLEYTEM